MTNTRTKLQLLLLDNLIWVLFLLLFVVNAFIVPNFFTFQNIVNIFYHVSTLGLLVLAEGIVLIVGHLDLSLEATLAFAPGISVLLCRMLFPGIGAVAQILIALLIGVLVGFLNGLLITRLRMNAFLETLSANIVLRGLVYFLLPFALVNLSPAFTYAGSARIFDSIPVAVLILIGAYIVFAFIMAQTRFGRFAVATGGNPRASYIAGVRVNRIVVIAFSIAGFLAALAGLLAAGSQGSITNGMGTGLNLMAIAGPILGGVSLTGGRGTVFGMLGGTLLLSLFDNSLTLLAVNVYLVNVIKGSLILFAIILDSVKTSLRANILYRERLRILKQTSTDGRLIEQGPKGN